MSNPIPPISLEFFPPKTPEGVVKLAAVRQQLYVLKPQFCSVTYGAGGSTQDGTQAAVQAILAEGCEAAPHFSCIGASRASIRATLAQFKARGIRRIVALRGDLPSGYGGSNGEFHHASDLVAFIRTETGDTFHIEVAAYPEMHPQARSPQADLQAYLAKKVQAGASFRADTDVLQRRCVLSASSTMRSAIGAHHPRGARHHADHQRQRHHPFRRQLRRRHAALDPPAPAGLRRRHGLDQGVRPRRGRATLRAACAPAARRGCTSTR